MNTTHDAAVLVVERLLAEGDGAVLAYTREFDTGGAQPWPLRVEPLQLDEALDALPGPLRDALELAAGNVRAVALAAMGSDREVELPQGQTVTLREAPVRGVCGDLRPGGGGLSQHRRGAVDGAGGGGFAVPASPPRDDGESTPWCSPRARCAGSRRSTAWGRPGDRRAGVGHRDGERVDVIVGPGNLYVQEAKRQTLGPWASTGFAGPSELVVVVDETADVRLVGARSAGPGRARAGEPGRGRSPSAEGLDALADPLANAQARAVLVDAPDLEAAMAIVEDLAPEHLAAHGRRSRGPGAAGAPRGMPVRGRGLRDGVR